MKEEDAKKKWCPLVRSANYNNAANRGSGVDTREVKCIGSECMAWRQSYSDTSVYKDGLRVYKALKGEGYCGAFGQL